MASTVIGGFRREMVAVVLSVLLAVPATGLGRSPGARAALEAERWTAKIHAGWGGKVAAGSGALPTEMWTKERIKETYGLLNAPPQKPNSRGPLDDTTLALLGWLAAHRHGPDFTAEQIARLWVDHLTDADLKGGGFGREFLDALARLRRGEQPPIRVESPRAEWIAAQMRAEVWGMLAPGDPTRAAEYAARDASIFNTGNGVFAAQFIAALARQLMVDPDLDGAIAVARRQVPTDAVLARLIDDMIRWHREEPNDWQPTWERFKQAWEAGFWAAPELRDTDGKPLHGHRPAGRPYRHPLEFAKILPETFSVLTGLLYGGGDFRSSVSIATMCGFDTDCNAGTVGCLLGLRNGLGHIPAEWKAPLNGTYELQVTGLPRRWKIADLAGEMAATGAAFAPGKGPSAEIREGTSVVTIAAESRVRQEPDPAGPATTAPEMPIPLDPPQGFGAASAGGKGGRVILVNTLADRGPGSLREALETSGPRTILFAVAGTIKLDSRLRCTSGRVTIDGGSAPGEGITLLNHGIQFRGDCDDIIVRNLRIRVLTGGAEGDCLLFWGNEGGVVERVLVDHCSLMWATDEVVNTWGNVRDLTCQWTILAEAQLPHSKGWLSGVGSDRISIHHCLFAHNGDRVPKLEGGLYELVNNVFYNWDRNNAAKIESGARVNVINNCFLPGADSSPLAGCVFPADPEKGTKVYVSGNIGPYTPDGAGLQWANVTWYQQSGGGWRERRPAPDGFRAARPLQTALATAQPAREAAEEVLSRAGAKVRDTDDLRVIRDVRERTGRVGRNAARGGDL